MNGLIIGILEGNYRISQSEQYYVQLGGKQKVDNKHHVWKTMFASQDPVVVANSSTCESKYGIRDEIETRMQASKLRYLVSIRHL